MLGKGEMSKRDLELGYEISVAQMYKKEKEKGVRAPSNRLWTQERYGPFSLLVFIKLSTVCLQRKSVIKAIDVAASAPIFIKSYLSAIEL